MVRKLGAALPLAAAVAGLCALAAPMASASEWSPAKNLTAFTCVKGEGGLDFSDAHCENPVTPGTGGYGHVAIPVGKTTEVETTNAELGAGVLKTSIFGVELKITCAKANGTGTFKNEEPMLGVHTGSGEGTTHLTECTVDTPAGCKVVEPISFTVLASPVEAGERMGGELKPKEGTIFTTVALEKCTLAGLYAIKGTAVAVGGAGATAKSSGSTAVYLPENENLTFGGNPASITIKTTVRTTGGIPLSGTTVT